MPENIQKIIESLSPLERKIVPFLNLPIKEIKEKTKLDNTSIYRALQFLANKKLVEIKSEAKKVVELGTNGIYYKKNHLPERKLLIFAEENNHITIEEARKLCKLSDNEFKKKMLEEQLIDALPLDESRLEPEQQFALQNLKKRKDIVEIKEKKSVSFKLTELGKEIAGKEIKTDLTEEVTPDVIKNWKRGKKFRAYDIQAPVPKLNGGKKHFVNQSIEYAKRIWLDLGFKEMNSTIVQTSFWNFDALFTAQDHPVREMQDTFFIKNAEGRLPANSIVSKIKKVHEEGVDKSRGWQYKWDEEEAKKVVLRTHTTCLSAITLASLDATKDIPAKFFALGKNFRNETLDWSHGFEFNQTEGIVIDRNLTFRHLL